MIYTLKHFSLHANVCNEAIQVIISIQLFLTISPVIIIYQVFIIYASESTIHIFVSFLEVH